MRGKQGQHDRTLSCVIQSTFIHIIILKAEKKDLLECDVCMCLPLDTPVRGPDEGKKEGSERWNYEGS